MFSLLQQSEDGDLKMCLAFRIVRFVKEDQRKLKSLMMNKC